MYNRKIKIFSGNSNPKLAQEICTYLNVPLGKAVVGTFVDGECKVKIKENVRGTVCFVIQSTCPPVNDNLMELLTMIDALGRASAREITAVIPYYGYGRQDKKDEPRVPITAKLVAGLLSTAGASRILSMDLRAAQIQGFFQVPVDHLFATPVILEYLKNIKLKNMVIISPDPGGVERARAFAKHLKVSLAIIDKRRPKENIAHVMNIVGEVKGKNAVIVDDMVDTGGTLTEVAKALKNKNARTIFAACSHGVLSYPAISKIEKSPIKELIITNSIPLKIRKVQK